MKVCVEKERPPNVVLIKYDRAETNFLTPDTLMKLLFPLRAETTEGSQGLGKDQSCPRLRSRLHGISMATLPASEGAGRR